jgi:hypothetical protein
MICSDGKAFGRWYRGCKDYWSWLESGSVTVLFSSLAFCSNGADSGQLGKFWEAIGKGEVLVKGTQGVAILPELSPRAGESVIRADEEFIVAGELHHQR